MQTNNILPQVHVTNYQQYINADFLAEGIANMLNQSSFGEPDYDLTGFPENMYISIAYIDVLKQGKKSERAYKTILAVNIQGKAHRYELLHNDEHIYLAMIGLTMNNYGTNISKDQHIRLLQQAFETLVFMRIEKIIEDLIKSYAKN